MFKLAIIGGTGLSQWAADHASDTQTLPLATTPYGAPSAAIQVCTVGDTQCYFLPRHSHPHSIPPHKINYRANIWALNELNVDAVVAINAVGGIGQAMEPGAISCPNQIVDYTWGREHTYFDGTTDDLLHVEFDHPYHELTRQWVIETANQANISMIPTGVYGATQGPRLETVAEITRLKNDGCDLVGMTGMPEAALAKELKLPYACVSVVVNWAAGLTDDPVTHESIKATLDHCMKDVHSLLMALCQHPMHTKL